MEFNYTDIAQAVAVIISAGAVAILSYCMSKYGKNNVNKVLDYVRIAVKAVEQLGYVNGWDGKQKKSEALDYVTKTLNGKGIKCERKDLDMMIESIVAEFNRFNNQK
ncbi:phage holin family protein [Peptoniphilus sp. MSJ-1]|uniref:Phage holin family protein n=1 Tax=Peptoniphilus ovalis TaxID=2841503 RepID=A0ABS6FHP0_9FIRM|nr:phage holin, LLH family [Peptoniphilus ovalis]MBU5669674.1 phage holin family protein [Peptoniphilus ovalis]